MFDAQTTRIIRYDDFPLEAAPKGTLLITRNHDVPGAIGMIGTFLGQAGVNISALHLGKQSASDDAIAFIEVDSAPTKEQLRALENLDVVRSVKLVRL